MFSVAPFSGRRQGAWLPAASVAGVLSFVLFIVLFIG